MTVTRLTALLLAMLFVFISACSAETLNLDPEAGKALIRFSARMTDHLSKAVAELQKAATAKEAAKALVTMPALFRKLQAEATSLQAQFKKQNFADFRTAASKRNIGASKATLKAALLELGKLSDKDGAAFKSLQKAVDQLVANANADNADKLQAVVVADLSVFRNGTDKKVVDAATLVASKAAYFTETVLAQAVNGAAAKLQAAMKQLDEAYKVLAKKYKEDAVFQAADKKMKEEMKKIK